VLESGRPDARLRAYPGDPILDIHVAARPGQDASWIDAHHPDFKGGLPAPEFGMRI